MHSPGQHLLVLTSSETVLPSHTSSKVNSCSGFMFTSFSEPASRLELVVVNELTHSFCALCTKLTTIIIAIKYLL